jgi:drug/metabolite transporter (DMT)-like permease
MATDARTMTAGDWGVLLLLGAIWGGSFFFIELALMGFPPLTLVLARLVLAAVTLWVALRASGGRMPRGWAVWRALLAMALLNSVVPWVLFASAQTEIDGGLAAILNAVTPIWGVVLAHFVTSDEKATANRLVGVTLGFGGVVWMIGADALAGMGGNILPQLACLVATILYALAGLYGRRFHGMGLSPLATATGQIGIAALVLAPVAAIVDRPWTLPMPGAVAWAGMAALALVSTALAFVLFFRLLARAGATNTMLVTFVSPAVAVLLGVLILGEKLQPQHFTGMALITLGLVAIDGRLARAAWVRLRRPAASL